MYRLGFGTLRLPVEAEEGQLVEIVKKAYQLGIRYFDCAPTYCGGKCEKIVGTAVKDFRKDVILASKIPLDVLKKQGDLLNILRMSLKNLQTDHLDYYFFWGVKRKEFEEVALGKGFLQEMYQAKKEGLIRNVGFSFHDTPEYAMDIIEAAEAVGCPFDAMLSQYNILDRRMEPWIQEAKSKGLTNLIMGAAAGGKLDYEVAYPFVWENSNVDCLLSGFQTLDMVEQNICLEQKCHGLTPEILQKIEEELLKKKVLKDLYCTGCGYCMPCPAGINIPEEIGKIQKAYKERKAYHPEAEACMDCGRCEKKCPQGLPIRIFMKR